MTPITSPLRPMVLAATRVATFPGEPLVVVPFTNCVLGGVIFKEVFMTVLGVLGVCGDVATWLFPGFLGEIPLPEEGDVTLRPFMGEGDSPGGVPTKALPRRKRGVGESIRVEAWEADGEP